MPSLVIPRSGLPLEVGAKQNPPSDVLGLTLDEHVIEDMIKCVRSGEDIQLSLGVDTTIAYASTSHHLTSSEDPFSCDVYQSSTPSTNPSSTVESPVPQAKPARGPRKAVSSLGYKGSVNTNLKVSAHKADDHGRKAVRRGDEKAASATPSTVRDRSASKGPAQDGDHAVENLRNSLAAQNAKKSANTTQFVKNSSALPPAVQKKGPAASVRNGTNSFATSKKPRKGLVRSLPASPALPGATSPDPAPTSIPASQQQAEKTKAIRSPIIHRLALGPATEDELLRLKTPSASVGEFKTAIEKVADSEDGKWKIHPKFYKDLDVWKYDYKGDERQIAIDNAIRAYDKMRLNPSEPQWQMLLPVAERGRGKCLSKLQAKIAASGNLAPKPKPKPVDDSSRESAGEDEDDLFGEKPSKPSSEPMAQSSSQNSTAKSKAVKEREAQDKRLSGKGGAKPAPKKAPPKKQTKEPAAKSSEFVRESEEEDDLQDSKPAARKPAARKPAPKKQAKEVVKSAEYVSESDEDAKPTQKTTSGTKAQTVSEKTKKPSATREYDDAADANTAASKKPSAKRKSNEAEDTGANTAASKKPRTTQSPLVSGNASSQVQKRGPEPNRNVSSIQHSINNSRSKIVKPPRKPSPLSSSPPTNASDMERVDSTSVSPETDSARRFKRTSDDAKREESPRKKRKPVNKAEMHGIYDTSKFGKEPSTSCVDASAEFEIEYDKYRKLYMELQADPGRYQREHERFMKMHEKLTSMKRDIIESARD